MFHIRRRAVPMRNLFDDRQSAIRRYPACWIRWAPVHMFAGAGLNSLPGVALQTSACGSRSPKSAGRYGLESVPHPGAARVTIKPLPVPLSASDATISQLIAS